MQNIVEIEINKDTQTVWTVLFEQFGDVGKWYSGVKESYLLEDSDLTARVCHTDQGEVTETIMSASLEKMNFEYLAKPKKVPFFIKEIKNHWEVIDLGKEKSKVRSIANVTLLFPFNILLGATLKKGLSKAITGLAKELKNELETK